MSSPAPDELPRIVQLAWGLDDRGTRGPRRTLTLEQVLDAAIAVANEEGFAALSMSRVAKQLGFTTMSLYRYVDSKDQLVELAWDRALGPPPELPAEGDWRDRLDAWASAEYRALRAYKWLTEHPIRTAPHWPNNMRWLDAGLDTLAGTSLDEGTKVQVILTTSLYVVSRARFSWELESAVVSDELDYAKVMPRVLDPEKFPRVLEAVRAGAFDSDGTDDETWHEQDFRFGLERLLDGIDVFTRSAEEGRSQ